MDSTFTDLLLLTDLGTEVAERNAKSTNVQRNQAQDGSSTAAIFCGSSVHRQYELFFYPRVDLVHAVVANHRCIQ